MGVVVSSSHVVSAAPSSSHFPCSSVGSLSWETVLHELLQHEFFPQAAVLHELLQRGFLPPGAVLQEQAAPAWVPHRVTSPASKPAPAWAPLSVGPQVLPGACSSMGSPRGHNLLQASTCSSVGSSMVRRGTACLTTVFSAGCRSISAPAPGAPPPSPFSLTFVSTELLLSRIATPLFCFNCHYAGFLPLLNVIPEALPPSLMGSALASGGSILEPAGVGSIRHRGSF